MITENLQKWGYIVIFFNISVLLISLGGFFPYSQTVGDSTTFTTMHSIVDDISEVTNRLTTADSVIDYGVVIGYALINGISIIVKFLYMIFTALSPIAALLRIPSSIYVPLQLGVDLVLIYDFGKLLFNR